MRHGTPVGRAEQSGSRIVLKMPVPTPPDHKTEDLLERPSRSADSKSLTAGMSVSLWSSINPGYILQEPANVSSIASRDYRWNEKEASRYFYPQKSFLLIWIHFRLITPSTLPDQDSRCRCVCE